MLLRHKPDDVLWTRSNPTTYLALVSTRRHPDDSKNNSSVNVFIKLLITLLEGNRLFSSSKHPKLFWAPTNLLLNVQWGGGNRGSIWTADRSPRSSAQHKNQWSYAFTPLHAFTAHRASPQQHSLQTACLSLTLMFSGLPSAIPTNIRKPLHIIMPQQSQYSCHRYYICKNDIKIYVWTSTHAHIM